MNQFDIPWQVQARMIAQGLTKEQVCEKIGINKRTFYLSLTGRQNFNLDIVNKLADVLGCKMEELLQSVPETYK